MRELTDTEQQVVEALTTMTSNEARDLVMRVYSIEAEEQARYVLYDLCEHVDMQGNITNMEGVIKVFDALK